MQIEIEALGFSGFYGGIWDQGDNEWDKILDCKYSKLKYIDDWGFAKNYREEVAAIYAERYIEMLNKTLGLGLKLRNQSVDSPREYNFRTDRIYCLVEIEDYDALTARLRSLCSAPIARVRIAEVIKQNHTSYSGFWSWMSNDFEEWMGLIEDPDNAHYVSYLIGYLMEIMSLECLEELNYDVFNYVCEFTDLHQLQPRSANAKDEWSVYEKFGDIYLDYAEDTPDQTPDRSGGMRRIEWEDYKEAFLKYGEPLLKERKQREWIEKNHPKIPGLV